MSDNSREERFRSLYDAAYPRIMAYAARRVRSPDDALDVVSETFVTVWRRLDDVPDDEGAIAWIYGVARRVLANHYRGDDRKQRLSERLRSTRRIGEALEPDFTAVHDALAALSTQDRELLQLIAWDELDNAEAAPVLGVSPGTVAVRLHRARTRLAKELVQHGLHSEKTSNVMKSEHVSRTLNGVNGPLIDQGEEAPQ